MLICQRSLFVNTFSLVCFTSWLRLIVVCFAKILLCLALFSFSCIFKISQWRMKFCPGRVSVEWQIFRVLEYHNPRFSVSGLEIENSVIFQNGEVISMLCSQSVIINENYVSRYGYYPSHFTIFSSFQFFFSFSVNLCEFLIAAWSLGYKPFCFM